jgi:type II secretory pathway pseudopilin PulG
MKKRRSLRRGRGFTLVELMISLVMGMLVALAAVALSKAATTTFYEQARLSGVEANVRSASERLRNDLSRASFMSTPNIQLDPMVARPPGARNLKYRVSELEDLRGIRIKPADMRGHTLNAQNGLMPQDLIVTGNLSTDDVYRGTLVIQSGNAATIRLNSTADAAVRRLFAGTTDQAVARAMTQLQFAPGEAYNPPIQNVSYAVQVMDARGCFHYVKTKPTSPIEIASQANSVNINVEGDTATGILTPTDTGGDICGARLMEEVAIVPIQRVKWALAPEKDTRRIDRNKQTEEGSNNGADKLNLTRQLLSTDTRTDLPVGPAEVVAEYAVDLKFALTIDATGGAAGATSVFVPFEAQDPAFDPWVNTNLFPPTPNVGPHRVRSVRYRLAFRAPVSDREADLPMGAPYLARYCTQTGGSTCTRYARVRTVISEVALVNQQRNTLW